MLKRLGVKVGIAAAIVAAGIGITVAAGGSDPDDVIVDAHGARITKSELTRVLRASAATSSSVPQAELAARGEKLFNSEQVAKKGESCASCHITGGGVNAKLGVIVHEQEGSGDPTPDDFTGPRDAPALWDVARTAPYNWIGGNPDLTAQMTAAIKTHFTDETPKGADVAALEAFMKTIKAPVTRQDQGRLTGKELAGEEIFVGKGGCIACHIGPSFTDNQIHTINVPQNHLPDLPQSNDPGSANIPGGFNTPQLRDVRNTAPYMHNGKFDTLEEVVEFYNTNPLTGGPLRLTPDEIDELVAYLKAL